MAIADAFQAARRRLDDFTAIRRGQVKGRESRASLRTEAARPRGGVVSEPERRRFPRSVPTGSTVAVLVTERLVAHGRPVVE